MQYNKLSSVTRNKETLIITSCNNYMNKDNLFKKKVEINDKLNKEYQEFKDTPVINGLQLPQKTFLKRGYK